MGCTAITPHLVSLAERLQGKPFHLIASYCQGKPKDEVIRYVRAQKLPAHTPNFTITRQGRHPKVKGNGHVPYYMVFDHRGKLVEENMCGAYHGGDGLKMVEWSEKLTKAAPEIYLGPEPFSAVPKLAKAVERKKKLGATYLQIVKQRATATGAASTELERLESAVTGYRDRELARVDGLLASNPAAVAPLLKRLTKELKGCDLAADVTARQAALARDRVLKESVAAQERLDKVWAKLDKDASPRARARQAKVIDKLIEKYGALPYVATLRAARDELQS